MLTALGLSIRPGQAQPVIDHITPNSTRLERYGKFELSLDITASYTNPYDFEQVSLQADFIAPSGTAHSVDGFYFQNFASPRGNPVSQGEPLWKIRFSPTETGTWRYVLRLRDTRGSSDTLDGTFSCDPAPAPGFIRRADTHFLRFDDGSQYFALGENMAWGSRANPVTDFERWMGALAANGGNYIRTWMPSWGFAIEWLDTGLGDYTRRQSRAFQLDWLIEHARQRGIYIQLVLNNHGQLSSRVNPEWHNNPYNAANGGPCGQPWEFFTLPQAKEFFKRRLRYMVARWGYATTIMAWEFFNEVDLTDGYATHKSEIIAWHAEMGTFLKILDPNNHLITTSFSGSGGRNNGPTLWDVEAIDFSQTHYYGQAADPQQAQVDLTQDYLARFDKPSLVGEFCFSDAAQARTFDPEGIYLHNTLWATAFSGGLGAAAIWWWDNYIHPLNLYHHFAPLSRFFSSVDLVGGAFRPVAVNARASQANDCVRSFALEGGSQTIGWVQNCNYNWRSVRDKGMPATVQTALLSLAAPAGEGSYTVDWWSTATGSRVASGQAERLNGRIQLNVPPLSWDLAYKITPDLVASVTTPAGEPTVFALAQNFPNPFNHATTIRYQISSPVRVHLDIFDSLGRRVRRLIAEDKQPGLYTQIWNGRDGQNGAVGSGVYFYRLETDGRKRLTKPMVFLK
jgi:hypothetical protein